MWNLVNSAWAVQFDTPVQFSIVKSVDTHKRFCFKQNTSFTLPLTPFQVHFVAGSGIVLFLFFTMGRVNRSSLCSSRHYTQNRTMNGVILHEMHCVLHHTYIYSLAELGINNAHSLFNVCGRIKLHCWRAREGISITLLLWSTQGWGARRNNITLDQPVCAEWVVNTVPVMYSTCRKSEASSGYSKVWQLPCLGSRGTVWLKIYFLKSIHEQYYPLKVWSLGDYFARVFISATAGNEYWNTS